MNDLGIPNEMLLAACEDLATREKQVASINIELAATLQRLKDDSKREIRGAIDADKREAYEVAHDRMDMRYADLAGATRHTTESLKLAERMRHQLTGESRRALDEFGIDRKTIRAIQSKYIVQARAAVEDAFLAHEEAPYVEVSDVDVPTRRHNPWSWRDAPYFSQWGTQWSNGTRGSRWVAHSENRLTGALNCWNNMAISGADDSDYTYTNAYSELQFWYQMPKAGLVEVWLFLQAVDTPYGGCLSDEWGFSDANIQELSRPYLWVLSPYGSPRYGTLLDYRRGEDEGCWGSSLAPGGGYRYVHLYSLDSYAAGQWVLCGVGLHDYNYFWVNDMSCSTYMTSRWFLRDVAVRSTGAP